MAIDWGSLAKAVIPAAASVGSALIGSSAASKAAQAGSNAANQSAQAQLAMYDRTREDYAPYRQGGYLALDELLKIGGLGGIDGWNSGADRRDAMARFTASPGYQFRLDEGTKAIERSAAARGGLNSGATLKALADYGQNVASTEYGNYVNRLASLAGVGQTAVGGTASAGTAAAGNAGNAYMAGGNAAASGALNRASSYNNALANLMYAYGR